MLNLKCEYLNFTLKQRSSFQASFGQTIVLENAGIPSGDYVTNGGSWQFQIPDAYESPLVVTGAPECVNCSSSQSVYWRRAEGGHTLCHQCSYMRPSRPKIPKNKPPVVSGTLLEPKTEF